MPAFELDGGVIFVPHIPANVNLGISDHRLEPISMEIWIAFLPFFVLFLRIDPASNDIDQLAAFTDEFLTDVGFDYIFIRKSP